MRCIGLLVVLLALAWPMIASADGMRRLFEPTDLGIEAPGTVEVDLQAGIVRGGDPYRLEVPDFEVDLGLLPWLEIDLDGALAFEDSDNNTFTFDKLKPDNLWLAAKFPLVDIDDMTAGYGLGFGLQVGPKLPVAPGAAGVGFEGLLLVGLIDGPTQLALNLGGLVDPGDPDSGGRPHGFEGGIDLAHPLDAGGHWNGLGQVGWTALLDGGDDQFTVSAGLAYNPSDSLEVSLMLLGGTFSGGERIGLLFGVAPTFDLWGGGAAAPQ